METIKEYLESMFRGLPETEKVLRAKSELFGMMEDKYFELIKEGKSENEAVGTVISEFGNLDELAESLGISDVYSQSKSSGVQRKTVSFETARSFLEQKKKQALFGSLAVFFFISCLIGPILADDLGGFGENAGVVMMFAFIVAGIALSIFKGVIKEEWQYLKREPFELDLGAAEFVKGEKERFTSTYSVMKAIGVCLCVVCWMPTVFFDDFGAVLLFVFVASGVFLLVYSDKIKKSQSFLLNITSYDYETHVAKKEQKSYRNETVRIIMSVYWPSVACVYLCISFLTFRWDITWLVWIFAVVVYILLDGIFKSQKTEQ